jgi:hypothetical protein
MKEMSALKQIHARDCRCGECYAKVMGHWIDSVGAATERGHWQLFITIAYSTISSPGLRPLRMDSSEPKANFACEVFDRFIWYLEHELIARVDFAVADQFGTIGGPFHQHAILSGAGLERYSRKKVGQWLQENAGWSRILPFNKSASFYISRYIGSNANCCEWEVRIGPPEPSIPEPPVGGVTVYKLVVPEWESL